jgi:hypothetical protein
MHAVHRLRGGKAKAAPASIAAERFPRRTWLARTLAALGGWLATGRLPASPLSEPDTSPQAREQAIQTLPLSELTAEARRKLMAVCERPSIYRRLPAISFPCDPLLHLFLIRNPEVVVNIWQLMGVASMSAQRLGPYLWKGSDGAGTTCEVELVYGTDELHVLYSDGYYEGSLLKNKVTGRCVLVLQSRHQVGRDGKPYMADRLDLFVQIDNTAADVIARTIAPWVGKVADANFHESCQFASKLWQTAEQNGAGVQRLAEKLTAVDPPVREQFIQLVAALPQRAASRQPLATPTRRL